MIHKAKDTGIMTLHRPSMRTKPSDTARHRHSLLLLYSRGLQLQGFNRPALAVLMQKPQSGMPCVQQI